MAKTYQRKSVPHLKYSPNVLQLPLQWREPFPWSDIKDVTPSKWPPRVQGSALRPDRGGIYVWYDVQAQQYLYVGRSRDLRKRFARYARPSGRQRERGVGNIDQYEKDHPKCDIWVFVAHCTEIEFMFIKSAGGTKWNHQHNAKSP